MRGVEREGALREKRGLKNVSEVLRERGRCVCSVLGKLLFGRSQSSGCVVC